MRPTDLRRLAILAEGQFGSPTTARPPTASSATGAMTSSPSSIRRRPAGTSTSSCRAATSRSWRRLDEALALPSPPDALLIGIAPTGGKLPDAWRATILEAIAAGLDVLSGLHTFLGDDPEFARPRRPTAPTIVDYRRPPERMETAVGRRHGPGKRVILTVGDRLRDRQDVGRARAAPGGAGGRRSGGLRADRPDRHDDRGLGRRGRPAHQRLRPGHRRVAGRGGRGARRLGHRRGPGLARPPGLLVGDAGAHPRRDAAGDGHGPQARAGRARLRPPARGVVPDRAAARVHRPARAGRRAGRALEGRGGRAQHLAATATTTRPAGSSRRSRPRPGCPTDDPFRFGADRLWPAVRAARGRAAVGRRG